MLFLTADVFLNSTKAAQSRGFNSVEEMNEYIISKWNSIVQPTDVVHVLGNIAMGNRTYALQNLVPRLNGSITLYPGVQDYCHPIHRDIWGYCTEAYEKLGELNDIIHQDSWLATQAVSLSFMEKSGYASFSPLPPWEFNYSTKRNRYKKFSPDWERNSDLLDTRLMLCGHLDTAFSKYAICVSLDHWDMEPVSFQDVLVDALTDRFEVLYQNA